MLNLATSLHLIRQHPFLSTVSGPLLVSHVRSGLLAASSVALFLNVAVALECPLCPCSHDSPSQKRFPSQTGYKASDD